MRSNMIRNDYPYELSEFIGNESAVQIFKILRDNKNKRNMPIPNILLWGYPGMGKTTLVQILADEINTRLHSFIAEQISEESIDKTLQNAKENDIIFIDEIHGLEGNIQEILYPVLQDGVYKTTVIIKNVFGIKLKEPINETREIKLPNITFIGATTDKGKIKKPLIDRFRYNVTLVPYTEMELYEIINKYSDYCFKNTGVAINEKAKIILDKISQNTPRILKNYFLMAVDLAIHKGIDLITEEIIIYLMKLNHIDRYGCDLMQQKYMEYLKSLTKPIGVNALSAYLGVSEIDIVNVIEPYLISRNLIVRTPRGRIIK